MNDVNLQLDHITAILRATPDMLLNWLPQLPAELLDRAERPGAWTTTEIVKHLIFGEQTDWIPRLTIMAAHKSGDRPSALTPFDMEGHFGIEENDINALLGQFKALRMEGLRNLDAIMQNHDMSELRGIHPALGAVTAMNMLSTWAVHDQTHIYQIARNLTAGFVEDIGPWGVFLKIVNQNNYAE